MNAIFEPMEFLLDLATKIIVGGIIIILLVEFGPRIVAYFQ
jgi:hypothetical protein